MLTRQIDSNPLPRGRASKPFDVFGFVRRYGVPMVVLGAFLFTMFVPGVILVSKPNYEVRAVLKIDPVIPSLITKSEDPSIINYFHDYARTQVQRIMGYPVLEQAIENLTPEEKAAFFSPHLSMKECVSILQILLKVKPISRTHLLELSLAGPRPGGLAPLVNNVMESFLEKIRLETERQNSGRLTYLEEKRDNLEKGIRELEDQLRTLASDIHTVSFSEEFNVLQQKVQQLQKLSVQLFGDRVLAQEAYEQGKTRRKALLGLSLESSIDDMVMKDQSLDFTSSWTYQELQKMRASIDGITPENRDRKYIERRMQAMREYEEKLKKDVRRTAKAILEGKRRYELSHEEVMDRSVFQAAKQSEAAIHKELVVTQKESDKITTGMLKGTALNKELEHSRNLLFRIDTRIHELKAESKAPLRIGIDSKARTPDRAAGSNTKKLLAICVILSFGCAGGAFLAYDILDNRIHGPRDVENALGHPPIWPISEVPEEIPFRELFNQAPNIQSAKAIRSLAVRLYREHRENQARVFVFTGVDRESGCTGIVLNTAQALATMIPRVLVMDVDEYHPDLSEHAALSGVTGEADDSGVVHDATRNISIMPMGKDGNHLARLQAGGLMASLKQEYDIVCIDADAVLQSDHTEYYAVDADAVILVSRGDSTLYRDLRRAAEIMVRLSVPAIAPVLNWGGNRRKTFIDGWLERVTRRLSGGHGQGEGQVDGQARTDTDTART